MTKHYIKSWAHFFDAIKDGRKLHDLRKMDRDYNIGDILVLQRYDNINGNYTGEEIEIEVTYITSNKTPCAFSSSALARDYAILSLKLLREIPWNEINLNKKVSATIPRPPKRFMVDHSFRHKPSEVFIPLEDQDMKNR